MKARLKEKGVFDVVSMSLFTQTTLPDWYFVCLINTDIMSLYVDNFINNTSHFQINDARQTPIVIPTNQQLQSLRQIFTEAQAIQKAVFAKTRTADTISTALQTIQAQLEKIVNELYAI